MATSQPQFRVIVRLPYNRPEESRPDPPRVEWNSEKEHILWEVIAKSRVVEGAGTDWKGLANHLQVPLPYLLYRAQARYEEDLRGLQGIQTSLNATAISPTNQAGPSHGPSSSASTPAQQFASPSGEYFPRISAVDKPGVARKDSVKFPSGLSSSTARPLAIRTRLNSLTARSLNSPLRATTSSVITLQGTKRPHQQLPHHTHLLSSSRVSRVSSDADSSEEDEELRKLEEEEKKAEEQAALDRKLKELTLKLTKDQLGLVLSPPKDKGKRREADRGRMRPLSMSSTASLHQQLHMSRRHSLSQTPSHHSLSSTTGSPQDSIPSIPSPPPEARSQPQSPSPMRHISPAGKSTSPPTVAYNNAWATRYQPTSRPRAAGRVRSDIGSEMGSTASSLSDFSDASLSGLDTSASALDSRGGSRVSSYARSNLAGRRPR